MNSKNLFVIILLFVVGIASRFIFLSDGESIFPNFTAIGAIALFGSNYFKGIYRWVVPFGALWVSDLLLNNLVYAAYFDSFQWFGDRWVYLSFFLAIVIGIVVMKRPSWTRLFLSAVGAGVIFYLVTNFAVWISPSSLYSKNVGGLLDCYIMALPFFRNTLLGNLFYTFLLFGVYEYVSVRWTGYHSTRMLYHA